MLRIDKHGSFKNLYNNIVLLISFCAFVFLTVSNLTSGIIALFFCVVAFVLSFFLYVPKGFIRKGISSCNITVTLFALFVLGGRFYCGMIKSNKVNNVAELIGISNSVILSFIIEFIGIIVAAYFCFFFLSFLQTDGTDKGTTELINSKYTKYMLYALTIVGMVLVIVFSFNGYIWADEAYSLRIVQYNWNEIIAMCAGDVHPPFYYLALKLGEKISSLISNQYYATVVVGKLFSVLPYFLLTVLCWFKFKDKNELRLLVILCIYAMPNLLNYSVEIRMYSWAVLFVTATFLYAYDIIRNKSSAKSWILLTVFSILSAYVHTFALISMASIWFYLLVWVLTCKRKFLIKWFAFGVLVAVCYFPWFLVLLRQVGYVTESYWISSPTIGTVLGYVNFILPGLFIFVPFALYIGLRERKNLSKQNLFESAFGALVLLATVAIGVTVSIIIRPIFVSRYMIPSMLCLWISAMLLSEKCSYKIRSVIIFLVAFSAVGSYVAFAVTESKTKQMAENNIKLIESFEDNSIIIISGNTHVSDTVAAYTTNMVYNWNGAELTTQTTKYREAYKNESIFDDMGLIDDWLRSGIPLYYFEVSNSDEENTLPVFAQNKWKLEYIGNYKFEYSVTVYKIIKVGNNYEL